MKKCVCMVRLGGVHMLFVVGVVCCCPFVCGLYMCSGFVYIYIYAVCVYFLCYLFFMCLWLLLLFQVFYVILFCIFWHWVMYNYLIHRPVELNSTVAWKSTMHGKQRIRNAPLWRRISVPLNLFLMLVREYISDCTTVHSLGCHVEKSFL